MANKSGGTRVSVQDAVGTDGERQTLVMTDDGELAVIETAAGATKLPADRPLTLGGNVVAMHTNKMLDRRRG